MNEPWDDPAPRPVTPWIERVFMAYTAWMLGFWLGFALTQWRLF